MLKYAKITPDVLERMLKMEEAGYKKKEIAYRLGTSYSMTKYALAKVKKDKAKKVEDKRIGKLNARIEQLKEALRACLCKCEYRCANTNLPVSTSRCSARNARIVLTDITYELKGEDNEQ